MATPAAQTRLTPEEYIAFERKARLRYLCQIKTHR